MTAKSAYETESAMVMLRNVQSADSELTEERPEDRDDDP